MHEFLKEHSYKAMNMFQESIKSIVPLNKPESPISKSNNFVLVQLFTSLYSSSESMIYLTSQWGLHDAEILLRTIVEGTIKYLFMSLGNLEDDNKEIKEFYSIIPRIQNVRNNNKMKEVTDLYHLNTGELHPFTFSLISEDEIQEFKKEFPRKICIEIEKKWSFGNILRELLDKNEQYKPLCGLYYAYSFSSHFIHQDGNSLSIRFESMRTLDLGEDRFEMAYASRLLSNVLLMFYYRYECYLRINNLTNNDYYKRLKEILEYSIELGKLNESLLNELMHKKS